MGDRPGVVPAALLAAALGALVLLEGYPWTAGFSGRAAEAAARGRLLGPVYARLLETENALARQDVLVASGFLALGAAHEFKNSLSLVRAAAEHGLSVNLPGEKDESLRLVLEQAREGGGAAVAFLERLAREGREAERVVDARDDLERLLRVCRATVRAEGIALRAEIAAGVRFQCPPLRDRPDPSHPRRERRAVPERSGSRDPLPGSCGSSPRRGTGRR